MKWLIERLAQRLREQLIAHNTFEDSLAAMAADPEIQRELQCIEEEFAPPTCCDRSGGDQR